MVGAPSHDVCVWGVSGLPQFFLDVRNGNMDNPWPRVLSNFLDISSRVWFAWLRSRRYTGGCGIMEARPRNGIGRTPTLQKRGRWIEELSRVGNANPKRRAGFELPLFTKTKMVRSATKARLHSKKRRDSSQLYRNLLFFRTHIGKVKTFHFCRCLITAD